MTGWDVDGFSAFFRTLWGWRPFAWQRALAERVLQNRTTPWPEAIDLPTAAGKTACIDIAIFTLAAKSVQTGGLWLSVAPRRVFFTVDRRVIVNEAYDRAHYLAEQLKNAKDGILFDVAKRLRGLAGGDIPLMCFQLRGGMYRSDAWARSPLQPTIITTTVDQVGSRLLFRAYGRSPKAWPIQAGLAGNDALILLDEAHCSQPFMETLHAVRRYRRWAETPMANAFHVSVMSATPPDIADVFRDLSEEPLMPGHPLGDRQMAEKAATLKEVKVTGRTAPQKLAKALSAQVEALVDNRPVAAVVFVNYVATAREVYRLLAARHGHRAILLTGRMRPIDKDDIVTEHLKRYQLSSSQAKERDLTFPVFVVATQTLEVGADLDFDVLVTECASLDALRQRFGRLNRMGRPIEARSAILMRSDLVNSSENDPVYGESICKTWQWLTQEAGNTATIDMGIIRLAERLPAGDPLRELNKETVHAPVMLPDHVDCWCQTMPAPFPTPDTAIYLHGPGRASADVQVCWRADIDLSKKETCERSLDVLTLCPPSVAETLAVPIWSMRRWMETGETPLNDVSDMEGTSSNAKGGSPREEDPDLRRLVVLWRGPEDTTVTSDPGSVRPGDVIVLPTETKGWEDLGDFPDSATGPILDWGDRAYARTRGKALLRLHPNVIQEWPEIAPKGRFADFSETARAAFDENPENFMVSLSEELQFMAADDDTPGWLRSIAGNLLSEKGLMQRSVIAHPLGSGVIIRGRSPIDVQAREYVGENVDWFSDENDASASGTTYVDLRSHLKGVAAVARRFAAGCGLPEDMAAVHELAGRLHDTGKTDPRFQALLRGGNPWARGELLAKSEDIPQSRWAYQRARRAVGYPEGGRHELLSVRMAESVLNELPIDPKLCDLMLHLIESHHGHCRPFAPVVIDQSPKNVAMEIDGLRLSARTETRLERLDSGVSDRFWRLIRRYGWWGLAWLESIFRLADHRQSEKEEKERRAKQ